MKHTQIEIFQIARTAVDKDEVQRWTDFLGANEFQVPDGDTITDPALLIALAAKRCYNSFQPGLNPNVTKVRSDWCEYLDNVLKQGHGCYDIETEVMTKTGWKKWPHVTMLDELATRTVDGRLEYHKPQRLVRYLYRGEMLKVANSAVDLLVTPNHNMLVCRTTTKEGRKKRSFSLEKAAGLRSVSHAYVKDARWDGGVDTLPEDAAALLGFIIGDMGWENGNTCRSSLRKPREIEFLKRHAQNLGWEVQRQTGDNYDKWVLHFPEWFRSYVRETYTSDGQRQIPPGFITGQTYPNLKALFSGLMNSDGSQDSRNEFEEFLTQSVGLAEQIQHLTLHLGWSSSISKSERDPVRDGCYGGKPLYVVSIVKRNLRPMVNRVLGNPLYTTMESIKDWTGEVFCAEVPNNTLYVRRNTIPVWSGNSVLEHSTFTYVIENVSRVFTAEMNRHRAGVSPSEASMRYIRFDPQLDEAGKPIKGTGIGYWVPLSIRSEEAKYCSCVRSFTGEVFVSGILPEEYRFLGRGTKPFVGEAVMMGAKKGCELCHGVGVADGVSIDIQLEEKKRKTREAFDEVFSLVEQKYAYLVNEVWKDELAEDSKFKAKKQITSCLRRIVPMGVSTGGVWTMNFRAVRHVLGMRATEGAEEEIAFVFSRIAKMMVEAEPMIFGDFKQQENGFWVPKYWKV